MTPSLYLFAPYFCPLFMAIQFINQTSTETADVMLEERVMPPPFYQVVLLNDDFTPMDFVIEILSEVFGKNLDVATQIMLKIHTEGRGVCGIFAYDIANTKMDEVLKRAQAAEYPLQCVLEKM